MKLTAAFLALLLAAPLAAQTAPTYITATSVLAWDHSGLNAAGAPEAMQGFILAIANPTVDMNVTPAQALNTVAYTIASVAIAGQTGKYQATAKDLLLGILDGQRSVWVQAVNQAALKSKWVRINGGQHPVAVTPPADPTNVAWKISLVTPTGTIWIEYQPN